MKITPDQIKKISGSFDLEIITRLDLSDRKLTTICPIKACTNLVELNLSNNKLSSLKGIEGCKNTLKILDLSGNKLTTLAGLCSLSKLEVLILSGNQLSSFDEIEYLKGMKYLRALHLSVGDEVNVSNEICKDSQFKEKIVHILPQLSILNGGHLKIQQSAAMDQLDKLLPELPEVVLPISKPWIREDVVDQDPFSEVKVNVLGELDSIEYTFNNWKLGALKELDGLCASIPTFHDGGE